jgi:hypothetical protein
MLYLCRDIGCVQDFKRKSNLMNGKCPLADTIPIFVHGLQLLLHYK